MLINGKRCQTTADLNLSNDIGRGDVAVDFNAIPNLAMSRIEVLRDGAAAQYGSDAISGVINMILDRSLGTIAQAGYVQTKKGDGVTYEVSASTGIPPGANGVLRLAKTGMAPIVRGRIRGSSISGRTPLVGRSLLLPAMAPVLD